MTQIEKLSKVLESIEKDAIKLFDESSFARKHNFTIEAQILHDKYQLLDKVVRDIRLKVIEQLIEQ
jgi:hypothetical protein